MQLDTDGDNYICTIQPGRNEATIGYDENAGSVTSANIERVDGAGNVVTYGGDSLLTTGIPKTVKGGEQMDIYITIAGASTLQADVTFNQSR